jgi:hypothetical protein
MNSEWQLAILLINESGNYDIFAKFGTAMRALGISILKFSKVDLMDKK